MPQTTGKYDWFTLHLNGNQLTWMPNGTDANGQFGDRQASAKFDQPVADPYHDNGNFVRVYDAISVDQLVADSSQAAKNDSSKATKKKVGDVLRGIADAHPRNMNELEIALKKAADALGT